MGRLELRSFWEKVIQPAIVGLILAGNDLERVNDPERRPERPLANGQFLLFRADAWRQIGGHGSVRAAIIDDVGLATATVGSGGGYHLVFGPKLFDCRMYSGLAEIWAGWSKNLFEGMGASWGLVAGLVGFVIFNIGLPWVVLPVAWTAGVWPLAGVSALAVCAQVGARVQLDRRFGQDVRYALTIPLGWSMLAAIAVWSGLQFHRGGARWKGRTLPAAGGGASGSGG
jgi:chlorobactene glucosyltransferase